MDINRLVKLHIAVVYFYSIHYFVMRIPFQAIKEIYLEAFDKSYPAILNPSRASVSSVLFISRLRSIIGDSIFAVKSNNASTQEIDGADEYRD